MHKKIGFSRTRPQSLLIVRIPPKSILPDHLIKLSIKRTLPVMDLLPLNICAGFVQQRLTNTHSKILMLPAELSPAKLVLVDPMRRFALEQLGDIADHLVRAEGYQRMYVLAIAADMIEIDVFEPGILTDMVENFMTNVIV